MSADLGHIWVLVQDWADEVANADPRVRCDAGDLTMAARVADTMKSAEQEAERLIRESGRNPHCYAVSTLVNHLPDVVSNAINPLDDRVCYYRFSVTVSITEVAAVDALASIGEDEDA